MLQRISRFVKTVFDALGKTVQPAFPRRLLGAYASLSKKERMFLLTAFCMGSFGIGTLGIRFYFAHTHQIPTYGGVFSEGVIDQPHYINPVLSDTNGTDQILEQLIFSGLTKPDGTGGYTMDLAQSIDMQSNGITYLVSLKDGLEWHDHQPLTTADVLFTLDLLKNKDLQNPQAYFWSTVQAEAVSAKIIKFTLQQPNVYFPSYLGFKILPQHIWKTIPVNQLTISEFNLEPIGSGPYQFKKIGFGKNNQIAQYTLTRFTNYASPGPYLDAVNLKFYSSVDDALLALKKKEIQSFAGIPSEIFNANKTNPLFLSLAPSQSTLIFLALNTNADILKDVAMRQAIQSAIDTQKITQSAFNGFALPSFPDIPNAPASLFNRDTSRALLASLGWKDSNNNGTVDKKLSARAKTPTELSLNLLTLDTPNMKQIATYIQTQLQQGGIGVSVQASDVNEYTSRLHNRSFQMALISFAPINALVPDFYPLLHSSQKEYPGLNVSGYANPKADASMELLRQTQDEQIARATYAKLVSFITSDAPIIFIAQPKTLWFTVQNFHMPAISFLNTTGDRFSTINQWYLYTKRIWNR